MERLVTGSGISGIHRYSQNSNFSYGNVQETAYLQEIICLEGTSQGIITVCGVELRRRFSMFSSSALMLLKCGNSPRGHLASTHPKAPPSKRNSRPLIDVLTFRRWGLYPTSPPGSVGVYGWVAINWSLNPRPCHNNKQLTKQLYLVRPATLCSLLILSYLIHSNSFNTF